MRLFLQAVFCFIQKAKLPIHGFELCAFGIHACMLTQIAPVVKGITRNLLGVGFIRLDSAQRIITKILDEFGIDSSDEKDRKRQAIEALARSTALCAP